MARLEFRTLRADEIDVRVGTVGKAGVTLLLYKDASEHSEDDLNHTGKFLPFSHAFWQTEDPVLIGAYEGTS